MDKSNPNAAFRERLENMNGGEEPIGTQTTTQSKGVCIPPALVVDTNYYTDHVRPVDGVMPSQTGANKLGVAMTMSLNYPNQPAKSADAPMDTLTGSRPMAYLANMRGTQESHLKSGASGLDEAMGTVSAGGNHHALISGRAMGFLQSFYGCQQYNGLDEGMGALSTRDRHALVVGERPALRVEDLYFRMLKAHEVKAGMAFDADYVVLGNQREQVKQLGNAVTPPVMEILVERCVESLM